MSGTASATSLNFIGFDEMVIMPTPRETAGKWVHPVAGFVPGQQPYLKHRVEKWNRSREMDKIQKKLAIQGFKVMHNGYF